MNKPSSFLSVTEENFDRIVDLNPRSPFSLRLKPLPEKRSKSPIVANAKGRLLICRRFLGMSAAPTRSVSCLTKHAIEGLSKAMAVELGEAGIRVNPLSPNYIDAPLVRRVLETPEKLSNLSQGAPMKQIGR